MANIGLTLKGNAVTEDDSILSLRLLEPTCTETDTILTIRSATAVKQNGQTVKAYTVPRKPSDFAGGSFDFGTVAANIPANNYCYALVTINSVDQIEVFLGNPSESQAGATLPTTANYQVALVKLKKGEFSLESIKNSDVTDRRATNQINEQPVFYTTDSELISEQYLAHVADNFVAYPNTDDNSVDFSSGKTSVGQYAAANMMTMKFSARTGTISDGTALTLTSAPSFTVRVGCWVKWEYAAGSYSFSRIETVTNQTTFTLASNLTNASNKNVIILEPVYTKNLVSGLGDSAQKTRLYDVFTENVDSVVIDYDDSAAVGDEYFDDGEPNVVCLVANSNIDNFVTTLRPITKSGTLPETFTESPSRDLHLVFLPNASSGDGSVNLLWYSCFLFRDEFLFNGGIINQSFGYTTSSTGLNCTFSVEAGKTVITLTDNFLSYVMNVNSGTPFGDLIVEDFGIEIPRRTVGLTDDSLPHYLESAYNKIILWDDLSSSVRQITVKRRLGTQDVSSTNSLRLNVTNEAIVGSSDQVSSGIATHSSLQDAINALSPGSRIILLAGNYSGNVNINKNDLTIVGKGRLSNLTGNLTIAGSGNDIQGLKVTGNLNLTGSYCFVKCWLSASSLYTAGGSSNAVMTIQE